jgi:hypothetical protein
VMLEAENRVETFKLARNEVRWMHNRNMQVHNS